MTRSWQRAFLDAQRLPKAYLAVATEFFEPLATCLAVRHAARGATLLVGVNGSQGSGKSTLCAYLGATLRETHGLQAVDLSLDDFYLTRREREVLATTVHPLLRTRGVPGTHDLLLLNRTLSALASPSTSAVKVPRFDKAEDDRHPEAAWPAVDAPLDIVLLEGWCLGARAVDDEALEAPINALERAEDEDGRWRRYVNSSLKRDYEPLYSRVDAWVMLAAPGFEQVLRWRTEQEEKLRAVRGAAGGAGLMDAMQLRRFVDHFERVTRQCLQTLPTQTDVLLQLDAGRNIIGARGLET